MLAKRIQSVTAVLVLSVAFSACPNKGYQQAAKAADVYAHALVAVHDAVDSAFVSARISAEERQGAYKALLRANEAGLHVNAALRAMNAKQPDAPDQLRAALTEADAAIQDGTAAIKNPDTKAQIEIIAQSAIAAISTIQSLYVISHP